MALLPGESSPFSRCGAAFELSYFGECLIGAWPKSKTWKQLFDRTMTRVRLKESELSEGSSLP